MSRTFTFAESISSIAISLKQKERGRETRNMNFHDSGEGNVRSSFFPAVEVFLENPEPLDEGSICIIQVFFNLGISHQQQLPACNQELFCEIYCSFRHHHNQYKITCTGLCSSRENKWSNPGDSLDYALTCVLA